MLEHHKSKRAGAVRIAGALLVAGGLLSSNALAQTGGAAAGAVPAAVDGKALAADMIARSFRDQGQAVVAWLKQDLAQAACSDAKPPADDVAKKIEAEALASIKWPEGNRYIGDWKKGESIAQSGRGMTWSDKAGSAAGGGCYNCHQLSREEISFGTIGPSLYQYGKIRGVTDPASAAAEPIVKYTWTKLWNAKSYNACSGMPRIGHMGILTMQQLQDVMALLLDPASPVNR